MMCPVLGCRQVGRVEMVRRGVTMFWCCSRHAEEIVEGDWEGWSLANYRMGPKVEHIVIEKDGPLA